MPVAVVSIAREGTPAHFELSVTVMSDTFLAVCAIHDETL
jgi:hypothetical protein